MEEERGSRMVVTKAKQKPNTPQHEEIPKRALSTTVSLKEIVGNSIRLEASSYSIDVRKALSELHKSKLALVHLYGDMCPSCSEPIRMKRHYVDEAHGIPFFTSSDIISLKPEARNFISKKITKRLSETLINEWDVLISRSGTIGNIGFAGKRMAGVALSEDALRLKAPDKQTAGYVAAYLRCRYGQLQLTKATYGSVITHIEPSHLKNVLIPSLHPVKQANIGQLFVDACLARDEANDLLDKADKLIHERLGLPPLSTIEHHKKSSSLINTVKASDLFWRFEASYHTPLVASTLAALKKAKVNTTRLDDKSLTKEVRAITKFRKRVYVEEGGIPLLSSKQLFQVDPTEVKGLAKGAHTKDLPEIALKKNMLAVTCSGTIGRVQIIPEYMEGWTANQHANRVIAIDNITAGFLYAWLASEYGYLLITRNSYGSVILELDKEMLSSVPVPVVADSVKKEIGELVLKANKLRDDAWQKEQDAINQIETLIKQPKS